MKKTQKIAIKNEDVVSSPGDSVPKYSFAWTDSYRDSEFFGSVNGLRKAR